MKRRNPSKFQPGDMVKLKRLLYGFPKGYTLEVVDGDKKPGRVGTRKCKYTILAKDPLVQGGSTYVVPTDAIE